MTEMTPENVVDQGQQLNDTGGTVEQQETRAPYADYVERFPDSLRPLAEQTFKDWDKGVTQKFQEVHSQYEPLKPWQQFAENGVTPDQAVQGLMLLQRLQENPQAVYEEIAKAFGFGQQGQQEPEVELDSFGEPEPLSKNPEFAQLQQMVQAISSLLVGQDEQQRQAAADQAVDKELSTLKQKYGDFDEQFVVTHMINGKTGEQAVQAYQQAIQQGIQQRQRPPAPTVMGAGGGVPSSVVNVGKLSNRETKNLVAQMLAQAAQEQ